MPYTGRVVPGGPTDIRRLDRATIRKMSVSEMHNNVYLFTCNATGEQLLVDAADDPHRCLLLVREGTGGLDHLVTTHRHWDHVRALEEVARQTGATTYAGVDDADALPVAPDVRLRHGDVVTVGELELDVIHLRGHTPGSVALSWADPDGGGTHLFTGDSLFPGGVGNTQTRAELRLALPRRRRARLRHPRRRHLVLPRPRRRLDDRRGAPAPRGVARARLVTRHPHHRRGAPHEGEESHPEPARSRRRGGERLLRRLPRPHTQEFSLGWVARYTSPDSGASVQLVSGDATSPEDSVISVHTDDVDAAYEQAQELGYEIVHPVTTELWACGGSWCGRRTATSSTSSSTATETAAGGCPRDDRPADRRVASLTR